MHAAIVSKRAFFQKKKNLTEPRLLSRTVTNNTDVLEWWIVTQKTRSVLMAKQ